MENIDTERYMLDSQKTFSQKVDLQYDLYALKYGCKIETTKDTVDIYVPGEPNGTIYRFSRKEVQEKLKDILYN